MNYDLIPSIRKHTGYQAYALLMLGKSPLLNPYGPSDVDKCVKKHFHGDWNNFVRHADYYLADGCGIEG